MYAYALPRYLLCMHHADFRYDDVGSNGYMIRMYLIEAHIRVAHQGTQYVNFGGEGLGFSIAYTEPSICHG